MATPPRNSAFPSSAAARAADATSPVRLGPVIFAFSALLSSQLHLLYRQGFEWLQSWRLLIAALPALALLGALRSARGRGWSVRLPAFWNRWLSQTWILVPGALADPLFPLVTTAAWCAALLMERRRDLLAAWSRRVASLPRAWVTAALMAAALVLVVLRAPALLLEPRLWAEDGRWFGFAYEHNAWEALTFVREYLLFYSNAVAALSANLFAVERAAALATYGALLVQGVALLVVAAGNAPFWDSPARKLVAMLLVLWIPPSVETWLVAVSSQFLFALITTLILCEEQPAAALRRWSYRALLGIAGLQGVLSCLLTPMFAYKWYRTRAREFAVQAAVLTAASLVQFFVLTWLKGEDRGFELPEWTTLSLVVLSRHVLHPVNVEWSFWLWNAVQGWKDAPLLPGALAVAAVALVYAWTWRELRGHRGMRLALLSALALVLFSITFALVQGQWWTLILPYSTMRYFYVPNVLLALCVFAALQSWRRRGGAARSVTAVFLVATLLASGALEYFVLNGRGVAVYDPRWPKWQEQVARWRVNPEYQLRIAPRPWRVPLKPRPEDRNP